MFSPTQVLEDLLSKSFDIAKNYISMLALNFEFEIELNLERDQTELRTLLNSALEYNGRFLAKRTKLITNAAGTQTKVPNDLWIKLQLSMLNFYSLMTTE